jgi:acid phosphatase type 7
MRLSLWLLILASCSAQLSCSPRVRITPPPAAATAEEVAMAGAAVLIGAGDIADCNLPGARGTAAIIDSVLKADSAANVEDAVFTLGDNAYPNGSALNFLQCFTPTWGDSAKSIMKKIRPSAGNHEHESGRAAPYYAYFGERAGSPRLGYYSYDIGAWHVIVLNSTIVIEPEFTAEQRKAQEDWLRADLRDRSKPCTLAYWHHPRFSSGSHGNDGRVQRLWEILYEGGADLVLNGHDHEYERFRPQTPAGVADTLNGITQIVVGTGGGGLRGFRTPRPNSLVRIQGYFGVLKLTLGAAEYRHAFLDTRGRVWDSAGGKCH